MLQLRALNAAAKTRLPEPVDASLETAVDAQVAALRAARLRLAAARGPLLRLRALLDSWLHTDKGEYFDDPSLPEADRLRLARWLHVHNRVFQSYRRFEWILRPFLKSASESRGGAPARLLELASGSGEFAMALSRHTTSTEIIGSDIQPAYVADAQSRADSRGLTVSFMELDALQIADRLSPGEVDVIFVAQSVHHFRPGQLALMIAGAQKLNAQFVAVDGYRGPLLLSLVLFTGLVPLWWPFWHDSVTTARKFYSEPELALIGRLAAPDASVTVRSAWPGFSVLSVGKPSESSTTS